MAELILRYWPQPFSRRVLLLALAAAALLVMAFYSITDSGRLSHDPALTGADYVGYAVCHRITPRSFTIAGRQLPLCARCTGIYLGVTLTFAVLYLAGRGRWSSLPPRRVLLVLAALFGLMGIDGLNSYSHFFPSLPHAYEPRNWLRLVTGMGAGLAMGSVLFPALAQTLWRDQISKRSVGDIRELAGLLLLAAVAVMLVLSNQPLILYVLGLASAAGVLLILTAVNSMTALIVLKRDAQAITWPRAALPLLIGLLLALSEVALVSFVRFSVTGTMTGFPGL